MKRTIKIMIAGIAGVFAVMSCSKEDVPSEGKLPIFNGDAAYLTVSIRDTKSATKASSPEEGFDYGANEQTVGTAHFYFYDHFMEFVTEADVWNGGTPSDGESGTAGNIEFKGNTVVVLDNLSGKTYPMYLVTVLNQPLGFTPGKNLEEMRQKLSSPTATNGGFRTAAGNFVMSTTSFAGQKNYEGDELPYFVTEVKAENFSSEPVDLEHANPVTVYVERLASKVSLNVADNLPGSTAIADARTLYPIHVTVAGDPNEVSGSSSAAETLWVELLGWKLNATAKYSYMLKNIDETWTNEEGSLGTGWIWNDPSNFRSYWCKSYNYNKADYPNTSGGATEGMPISNYLTYVSLEDNLNALGASDYCAENTNRAGSGENDIIRSRNSSAITGVLLKARLCDSEGKPRGNMVRYENLLWEPEHYLNYVLNALTDLGKINAYYETGESGGEKTYRQIDASCVELKAGVDGAVDVSLNTAADGMIFYKADDEGAITETVADQGEISAALEDFNLTCGAIGYKDGLMYYNIPIEHLNDNHDYKDQQGNPEVREANYGVVRNHSYRITVTKIETVGKGISNPAEVIVPSDDLESYYVGAQISILSWKIVEQNVEL